MLKDKYVKAKPVPGGGGGDWDPASQRPPSSSESDGKSRRPGTYQVVVDDWSVVHYVWHSSADGFKKALRTSLSAAPIQDNYTIGV